MKRADSFVARYLKMKGNRMKNMKFTPTLLTLAILTTSAAFAEDTPKSWLHAGSRPKDYAMSVDREVFHGGKASASIKCVASAPTGFGTLMQTFKAGDFSGKRVRMTGYVRSEDVTDWAGLWMRVDGSQKQPLAFDNMQGRPIKGTTDWTQYQVVLDVPESADEIAFGVLLTGKGNLWLDDLNFELVGKDVPTTGSSMNNDTKKGPANLDFED
jgi:hypothetical protein